MSYYGTTVTIICVLLSILAWVIATKQHDGVRLHDGETTRRCKSVTIDLETKIIVCDPLN